MTDRRPLHPSTIAAAVVAVMLGCTAASEIPDEPLPGKDAIIASFPDPELGTVILREGDLTTSARCEIGPVRTEGFARSVADRTLRLRAPGFGGGERVPEDTPGGIDLYGYREVEGPILAGDTLYLAGPADGCGTDGGDGDATVYITASDAEQISGVFEGDFPPTVTLFGSVGRGIRVFGAFKIDLDAERDREAGAATPARAAPRR